MCSKRKAPATKQTHTPSLQETGKGRLESTGESLSGFSQQGRHTAGVLPVRGQRGAAGPSPSHNYQWVFSENVVKR